MITYLKSELYLYGSHNTFFLFFNLPLPSCLLVPGVLAFLTDR